jgi:hypothetical protein
VPVAEAANAGAIFLKFDFAGGCVNLPPSKAAPP